jgi:DNA-binding IclR family transcriptional regulator
LARATKADQTDVNVIVRALDILDLFEQAPGALSMMAVVQRTGLHKATAFRLLTTLVHDYLLRQTPSGDYELGPFATQRATIVMQSDRLWCGARPIMEALRDQLNESVVLTRRFGDDCVDLDLVQASTAVVQAPAIGRRVSLHANVGGCAILASDPAASIESYLNAKVKAGEKRSAVLEAIARGRNAVAGVIRDEQSVSVAAMWLTIAPGRAVDASELQELLDRACRQVTSQGPVRFDYPG